MQILFGRLQAERIDDERTLLDANLQVAPVKEPRQGFS